MKAKALILGLVLAATSFSSQSVGYLDVSSCYSNKAAVVIARLAGGKYLGFSTRDSSGKITDYPPKKKGWTGWKEGYTYNIGHATQARPIDLFNLSDSFKSYS